MRVRPICTCMRALKQLLGQPTFWSGPCASQPRPDNDVGLIQPLVHVQPANLMVGRAYLLAIRPELAPEHICSAKVHMDSIKNQIALTKSPRKRPPTGSVNMCTGSTKWHMGRTKSSSMPSVVDAHVLKVHVTSFSPWGSRVEVTGTGYGPQIQPAYPQIPTDFHSSEVVRICI